MKCSESLFWAVVFLIVGAVLVGLGTAVIALAAAILGAGPAAVVVTIQLVVLTGGLAALFWMICWVVLFNIGVVMVFLGLAGLAVSLFLFLSAIWQCVLQPLLSGVGVGGAVAGFRGAGGTVDPLATLAALLGLGPRHRVPGLPFASGTTLLDLLFLPTEQRRTLPADVLAIVDCMRGCIRQHVCGGGPAVGGGGSPPDPRHVVVDATESLMDDLRTQLDYARRRKEAEEQASNFLAVAYWEAKRKALEGQIARLRE